MSSPRSPIQIPDYYVSAIPAAAAATTVATTTPSRRSKSRTKYGKIRIYVDNDDIADITPAAAAAAYKVPSEDIYATHTVAEPYLPRMKVKYTEKRTPIMKRLYNRLTRRKSAQNPAKIAFDVMRKIKGDSAAAAREAIDTNEFFALYTIRNKKNKKELYDKIQERKQQLDKISNFTYIYNFFLSPVADEILLHYELFFTPTIPMYITYDILLGEIAGSENDDYDIQTLINLNRLMKNVLYIEYPEMQNIINQRIDKTPSQRITKRSRGGRRPPARAPTK